MLSLLAISIAACGGGGATTTIPDEVPASITLSPAVNSSMDVGALEAFTATAFNRNNTAISETFSYQSSNPAVVTVANTGTVCAGTWDSLSTPTTCTPGPVGVAQVTATAKGISSPPTIVYVHEHITSIQISVIPSTTNPPPGQPCYSKGQTLGFQAKAYNGVGNNLTDITSSVGKFSFELGNSTVAGLTPITLTPTGQIILNQTQASASVPGTTNLYATASGVNSAPYSFVTCAVKSISLYVSNTSETSLLVPTGTSTTIYATVLDSLDKAITGVPLTWNSSNRSAVTVSAGSSTLYGGVGQANAPAIGASAVTASCTPPTCNIGFTPTLPIYPAGVISFVVAGNPTTTASYSVYVTSTGTGVDPSTNEPWSCADIPGCQTRIIPITGASTGVNTLGSAGILNSPPNSFVFEPGGTAAYLGVNSGQLGTRGLMVVTGTNTLTQHTSAPGKVLAVSPAGQTVIISDTVDTPNQVYVYSAGTSTVTATLNITGATAAAFSPDNLKAFIVAGSTLYIYSALDPLQTVPLNPPGTVANDVAFLPVGAFALIAGSSPDSVTPYTTCTGAPAPQVVTTPGTPSMLRPLPDGMQVLAMDPPGIDYLDVNTTSTGCPPTISNTYTGSVNLGQGTFVPKQFILSPDGRTAYIVTENSGTILVFSVANKTTSAITLTGNAIALQASLTPDGRFLYVGAEDVPPPLDSTFPAALGTVHLVDTLSGVDVQQIVFPQNEQVPQPFCLGPGNPPLPPPSPVTYCYPDIVAVKP
ncbi:MAG TPA: hypothetical protein VH079_13215 [Terriglobales bacterium]|jgi:hypothetical protein|nr:hypothetical protein [Terriglobales bacterium]